MRLPIKKLGFALANTAAVLAALYIAFARDLERPYWAMFTVFVVAKPISGAVRSKAVYRLFGTFAGAAISLLLVPPLVQAPVLLCLATSLWVGGCLYISLLDRTPRSYAFMLAGFTATIVGLAVVNAPETIFDTSVARVEEISLGLICAAVAHSVFFPQNIVNELNERIAVTIRACASWLSEAVTRPERSEDIGAQQRLAQVVTDLHVLYTQVAFETSDVPRSEPLMRTLLDRLAVLLPRVSSVQKAVAALAAQGSVSAPIARALESASHWTRFTANTEDVSSQSEQAERRLRAEVATASAENVRDLCDWRSLLERTVIINLRELIVAFEDSRILAAALRAPGTPLPPDLQREVAQPGTRALHRDRGIAFLSACAAAGSTLIACVLWIEGSWPEGAVAAQFAAIGCSVFATLDNPAKLIGAAVLGILVALPIAAIYEFAIFPQIDGFVSLALVLAPILVLLSLLQASEKFEGAGLVLAIAFSGGLALQTTYRPDFAAFVNSNAAEIVGLLIAAVTNLIFRTIDPLWNAFRISKAGWRSVRRLARGDERDVKSWTTEMFDRLGLVATRLEVSDHAGLAERRIDGLRDLRVGLNVATLQRSEEHLVADIRPSVEDVLNAIAEKYRLLAGRSRGHAEFGGIEQPIDLGISALCTQPPSRPVLEALAALTALRLDLAPVGGRYHHPVAAA
jgi:uncharacterized membrane protein YccC